MAPKDFTHRNRLETCLAGVRPDKIPVALWRHFPVDDQGAGSLARAVAHFQQNYDFDLIKVTPASSYCLRDWGVQDQWNGHRHGTRDYTKHAIQKPEDWFSLPVLDPSQGQLGMMVECLKMLVDQFSPGTPVLHTIFSPLSQAKNLVGPQELLVHLRKYPDAVNAGLEIIAESTLRFLHHIRQLGIDGIFFAVQHAQYGLLTPGEFERFGRKYDLKVLHQMPDFWLNIGHIHGNQVMFEEVLDYPLQVLNWHDQETPPSLSDAQRMFKGVVLGGLRQEETMMLGTPADVLREKRNAVQATRGERFILGTGCVLPIISPIGNIYATKDEV